MLFIQFISSFSFVSTELRFVLQFFFLKFINLIIKIDGSIFFEKKIWKQKKKKVRLE